MDNTEQGHGKRFERAVMYQSGLYPLMEGVEVPSNALHDIPSIYVDEGVPVSIKTARYAGSSPMIYCGDAERFYAATSVPLRMIAGFYQSEEGRAIFHQVLEVDLDMSVFDKLWGDVEEEDIQDFASFIKSQKARIGDDPALIRQLQGDARAYKSQLVDKEGVIVLNPKVAANVGRLQCSIDASRLYALVQEAGLPGKIHQERFGKMPLPVAFEAGARTRRAPG